MRFAKVSAIALSLAFTSLVRASTVSDDPTIDRLLRHDVDFPTRLFRVEGQPPPPPWEFDFGLSYTNPDGSGDTWELPLYLSYAFTDNDSLTFSTGYIRADDGTKASTGSDDYSLRYEHDFEIVQNVLSGSFIAGVVVPAGGSVGSNTARQVAQGAVGYKLSDNWTLSGSVALIHIDSITEDIDNTGERYAVKLGWHRNAVTGGSIKLFNDQRGGSTSKTTAELEYHFPISRTFGGSLTADQGLTSQHRDTSLEFDIAYKF